MIFDLRFNPRQHRFESTLHGIGQDPGCVWIVVKYIFYVLFYPHHEEPITKRQITKAQWFLGVSGKDGSYPDEALLMHLLGELGCQEIEPLGHGTAQARVPVDWADAVERSGFYTSPVSTEDNEWIIDIDLA
jgi:hypothetical protein